MEKTLNDYLADGLNHPFITVPDSEAKKDALNGIGAFQNASAHTFERAAIIQNVGQSIGGMSDQNLKKRYTAIYEKCANTKDGETVKLTPEEEKLLYTGK